MDAEQGVFILLIMAVLLLLPGGFFWYLLHLAKDPKNLEETRGELLWFRVEKNVHGRRGYRDIVIKRLIRYTYRYTVNGRTHKLRGRWLTRPVAPGRGEESSISGAFRLWLIWTALPVSGSLCGRWF